MRPENGLRGIASGCAVLLLMALVSDRMVWVYGKRGSTTVTDSAGYNVAAFLCGVVAILGLASAFWTWRPLLPALLGALATATSFAVAAYACGAYALAIVRGDYFDRWGIVVYPPRGPFIFTVVALTGFFATTAMVFRWLRQPNRRLSATINAVVVGAAATITAAMLVTAGWLLASRLR